MAAVQVDPEKVIGRLAAQVGELYAQLAVRDVALDEAHARITELEQTDAPNGGEPLP